MDVFSRLGPFYPQKGALRPVNVTRQQEEFSAFRDAIIYLQAQGGSCDKETLLKKKIPNFPHI